MNDRLSVFYSPRVLDHDTGFGFFEADASPFLPLTEPHPENDLRIRNMHGVLENGPLAPFVDWFDGVPATLDEMTRFHHETYVKSLADLADNTTHKMSSTTVFGPGSYDIVRVSAGLAIAAAQHVFRSANNIAYALCRPPGHHAQPAMADGYCFVNNVGVAVEALRALGLKRAAVIDWDVHHGNGTQQGFYSDGNILTISMHMDHGAWGDSHVQTGAMDERGEGDGFGKNINIPLPYGSGDTAYNRAFEEIVRPAVEAHKPEVLFIANGQDANQFDPNGRQIVSMAGFYELGRRARSLADAVCDGRMVVIQEGGYAISYAAYCLHASLAGMLGKAMELGDPVAFMPEHTEDLERFLQRVKQQLSATD
jgi:acetoin utilization deacetylase AcuC-like enzyme